MNIPSVRAWLRLGLCSLVLSVWQPTSLGLTLQSGQTSTATGASWSSIEAGAPRELAMAGTLEAPESGRAPSRSAALEVLCQRLDVGPGAVIADVGCGEGLDSVVFARVVSESGTVLAQEIDADKLKTVAQVASKHGLHQITPVLGQSDDPRLPDGLADLIYMNRVFHHFAKPQPMLQRLWQDLKPGGLLVIVDQQKGPLTDWAPMESREDQHHWTGETTVVRLAREAGFEFHDALDDMWYEPQPFVLAFRKPIGAAAVAGDPDLPQPLDSERLIASLPLAELEGAVAFCGLDGGRVVAPALRDGLPASVRFFDIVLEEWATSRKELPAGAPLPGGEILRTEKGALQIPDGVQVGAVVFVDGYHRLWEPLLALRHLKERMAVSGWVAVVDREGPEGESRRLAGHRRRISPSLVTDEMREAGFQLRRRLPAPTDDRHALLFDVAP